MGTEEPCIKLFNTELFQDEESGADITSRIHQTPFLKTQQQTVGKQEGRCFAYICPIFSTFPLPQGGVDSSVRPMRTFQFDLNEVMDGMKRRENLPRTVHFLSWIKHVEREHRRISFPRYFWHNLFYKFHYISENCDNWGKSTGISEVTAILKTRRLMEVKWGKSFILFYEAVELLRIDGVDWGIIGQDPNM